MYLFYVFGFALHMKNIFRKWRLFAAGIDYMERMNLFCN